MLGIKKLADFTAWIGRRVPYIIIAVQEAFKAAVIACFPSNLFSFYFAQIGGSVCFGAASDKCRRQKVLHSTLLLSCLAALLVLTTHAFSAHSWLFLSVLLLGFFLSSATVSRGLLLDLNWHRIPMKPEIRRQLMAATILSESISWVFLSALALLFRESYYSLFIIGSLTYSAAYLLSRKYISDSTHDEKFSIGKELKDVLVTKEFFFISVGVILFQGAFFYFFYERISALSTLSLSLLSLKGAISMSIGSGTLALPGTRISKIADRSIIIFSCIFAVAGIGIHFLCTSLGFFAGSNYGILASPLDFILLASGFALPCFYSIASSGHAQHRQGFIAGLIDSLRVLCEIVVVASMKFSFVRRESWFLLFSLPCIFFLAAALWFFFFSRKNEIKK